MKKILIGSGLLVILITIIVLVCFCRPDKEDENAFSGDGMDVVDVLDDDLDKDTTDDTKEDVVTAPSDWESGDKTSSKPDNGTKEENDKTDDKTNENVEQTGGYGELF